MNNEQFEQLVKKNGADVAPRVTLVDIKDAISGEYYFSAEDGICGASNKADVPVVYPASLRLLTFCVLTLKNGFTVTGAAACASPENFNAEIGKKVAYDHAVRKLWPLLGFALREKLHQAKQ